MKKVNNGVGHSKTGLLDFPDEANENLQTSPLVLCPLDASYFDTSKNKLA